MGSPGVMSADTDLFPYLFRKKYLAAMNRQIATAIVFHLLSQPERRGQRENAEEEDRAEAHGALPYLEITAGVMQGKLRRRLSGLVVA